LNVGVMSCICKNRGMNCPCSVFITLLSALA
jgi:hypothetical protein